MSDESGKDYLPEGAVVVRIASDRWFAEVGPVRIRVPAGEVTIRVERGTEYRAVIETVTVGEGKTVRLEINLERWIDMKALGYAYVTLDLRGFRSGSMNEVIGKNGRE